MNNRDRTQCVKREIEMHLKKIHTVYRTRILSDSEQQFPRVVP